MAKTKLSKKSLENLISCFGNKYKPNTIGIFDWYEKEVRPGMIRKTWVVKKVLYFEPHENPNMYESFYYRIDSEDIVEVISDSMAVRSGQIMLEVYKKLPDGSYRQMSSKILRTR